MINKTIVSLASNLKEKSTNPFLGTYAVVWFIRNWELVYSLFNFDKAADLNFKVEFIRSYYADHNFIEGLLQNIVWSFGILIVTYSLLNLSRFIVNFSEKRITPWIYKNTDSNSIVLKSVYESIRNSRDELQAALYRERDAKIKLEIKNKALDDKNTELMDREIERKIEEDSSVN